MSALDRVFQAFRLRAWPEGDALARYERDMLRTVLRAIREPVESQYDALSDTGEMWRDQTSTSVWRIYVDALLDEYPAMDSQREEGR